MRITQKYVNDIAYKIVGAAIEVHKELGPGLLESIYQKCMKLELKSRGLKVNTEVRIPIKYKQHEIKEYLRLDLIVENLIIVEIKAVELMNPLYNAQLLTYLKLTDLPKGLLINFNSETIIKSMAPLVTKVFRELPKE